MSKETIFFHLCPVCGSKVFHKNEQMLANFYWRLKRGATNGKCKKCTSKEHEQCLKDYYKHHDNPRKGTKTNYEIWAEKYGIEKADEMKIAFANKQRNIWESKSNEEKESHIRKSRKVGKSNGMYGRSYYEVWVEKYGIEEADRKMAELKARRSIQSSGKNNPMYGKPSPIGSGNGWSGWYKGWYFRSLRELSYVVNVLEPNNVQWVSGESKKMGIEYEFNGKKHTYYFDFFVDNRICVEIKPKRLMNTPLNVAKINAAALFCNNQNYEYRLVDVHIMDEKQLLMLWENNLVKFVDKYEKRMKERCKSMKSAQ